MLPSLTRKTLRDTRRALIGWTVGIGIFVLIYVSSYSSFRDDPEQAANAADRIPDGLASFIGGVGDMASGAGYLQMVIFQLFVPLLLIASATMWGTRAIAAPEESGSLDLLLSVPISRRRFVLERFAAMAIGVVVVALVVWILVLVLNTALDMRVGFAEISAACAGLFLLALGFGTLALAVSAFVGRRSVVLAVTGVVALGTYVLRSLSLDHDVIEPLRWLSPFHYYLGGDPLHEGFHAGHLAVLVGLVVAFAAAAVAGFTRRDVGT
jgi:ABC-2 type transport system permease protein